jgi:hypothetical protein
VAVTTASPDMPRWRSVFRPLNLALTVALGGFAAALFHFIWDWSWASSAVGGAAVSGVFLLQDLLKAWWYANDPE